MAAEETPLPPFDGVAFVRTAPQGPGIYQILGETGEILYVGKAKNLRKRLSSYFPAPENPKIRALVHHARGVQCIQTLTEKEAWLLENRCIKQYQPRFNVILRDDKSYPYLHCTDEPYPRISVFRGKRRKGGMYWGPYPDVKAVWEIREVLTQFFRLRTCEPSVFRNRTRPCLQYELERCTAPCMGWIGEQAYGQAVKLARRFVTGDHKGVLTVLLQQMEAAALARDYERAGALKRVIGQIHAIQSAQAIEGITQDRDVVGWAVAPGRLVIQVLRIRNGTHVGAETCTLELPAVWSRMVGHAEIAAWILQYYHPDRLLEWPDRIQLQEIDAPTGSSDGLEASEAPTDPWEVLAHILSDWAQKPVRFAGAVDAVDARLRAMALENAREACQRAATRDTWQATRWEALNAACGTPVQIWACFDASHWAGEDPYVAAVIAGPGVPHTGYRTYRVPDTGGDDGKALGIALRRYVAGLPEDPIASAAYGIIVDGGKLQLQVAQRVLWAWRGETGDPTLLPITLLAIAKGPDRAPGTEQIWQTRQYSGGIEPLVLSPLEAAFQCVAQLRDSAHRAAGRVGRQARRKARISDRLVKVPGLSDTKYRRLQTYFVGPTALAEATRKDLARVPGIGSVLADRIYQELHADKDRADDTT